MDSNQGTRRASAIGGLSALIVCILLLALVTSALTTVQAGHRGVKTRFGEVALPSRSGV